MKRSEKFRKENQSVVELLTTQRHIQPVMKDHCYCIDTVHRSCYSLKLSSSYFVIVSPHPQISIQITVNKFEIYM